MDIETIRFSARAINDKPETMATFDLTDLGSIDIDVVAERVKGVRLYPVAVEDSRSYWFPRDSGRKGIACEANDGLVGEGEPGGECSACPLRFKGCRITRLFRANVMLPAGHDGLAPDAEWLEYPDPVMLPISYNPKPPANTPPSTERVARMLARIVARREAGSDTAQDYIHIVGQVQSTNSFIYGQIATL